MKWIAIAGTWWKTNDEVERVVREAVRSIMLRGDGIISGGAPGVDFYALDEALILDPSARQIKIYISSSLETHIAYYTEQITSKTVTAEQGEHLSTLLTNLKKINPNALIEGAHTHLEKETFFGEIAHIIYTADELIAFHINSSEGTQNAITKAQEKGIPTKIFSYRIN